MTLELFRKDQAQRGKRLLWQIDFFLDFSTTLEGVGFGWMNLLASSDVGEKTQQSNTPPMC